MKMIKSKFLMLGFSLLIAPIFVSAQSTTRYETLESVRQDIVFPEFTAAEKRTVAEQAQIFVRDLYVHRYAKMDYYRNHEDPVLSVAEVVDNVDDMSVEEMEVALFKIFAAQRDLHMNYYFPAPYSNYTSFLPVTFTRTAGDDNFFQVRISAINKELFNQFAKGQRLPAVGDEILSYNNVRVHRAARKLYPIARGANEFGGFSRALQIMTRLTHLRYPVPEENTVTLRIRAGDDDVYTVTMPWIASWDQAAVSMRSFGIQQDDSKKRFVPSKLDLGVDDYQLDYNKFLSQHGLVSANAYPSNPSGEPVLTWGRINNRDGNFAYLRLASFVPRTSVDFTLAEIRRLLMTELADTDGLIFDVRNNGGGYIRLADMLSQFFMAKEADVLHSRLLNTDMNWRLYNETNMANFHNPEWKEVINAARGTNRTYTDGAVFTYKADANVTGQIYYKPVAVLMNARSYSATDMFSCAMQDNKAALLYGEDPLTGAGGANVITNRYFNFFYPEVFVPMPGKRHDGGYGMRVSWRQTMRMNANEGKIVEDFGCAANRHVSQTRRDVVTGGELQLKRITRSLSKRARAYQASVRGSQKSAELYLSRGELNYGIYVKNTPYVNVIVNGEIIDRLAVHAGDTESYVNVALPSTLPVGEVAKVTLVGADRRNRALWNLKRQITVLDEKVVLGANDSFAVDFATARDIAPIVVVNRSPAADGWQLKAPYLQFGYNPEYVNYLDTDAVVFFDLRNKARATLSFGMEFDTEAGWDFVKVYVTNNVDKHVVFSGSGYAAMQDYSFDLSEFAGQDNVAVHFRFTSDSNTTAPGVKMSHVTMR